MFVNVRMCRNRLKRQQERLRLDFRKHFLAVRIVKPWNSQSAEISII